MQFWVCYPQGDALLRSEPFASHFCHFCNIFNTDNRESVHRWSDDETWRLLIHISSTVAFQAALWWNPSRFIWPQGRDYCRWTLHRYEWGLSTEGGVGGRVGLSGLSPPSGLEQFSSALIHLYCVCGRPRMREINSPLCCTESHWAKDILNLSGFVLYREIKQHTKNK